MQNVKRDVCMSGKCQVLSRLELSCYESYLGIKGNQEPKAKGTSLLFGKDKIPKEFYCGSKA